MKTYTIISTKYIIFCIVFSCFLHIRLASQNTLDINHIIHMGQSLGAGEQAMPLVTDSTTGFGNIRFKIGTHTWTKRYFEGEPWLRADSLFRFVPLTAVERDHEGETIGSGMCDHLKSTSINFLNPNSKFLFSFTGQGGRLIRELNKKHDYAKDPRSADRKCGGGFYNTVIDDVKRAKATAKTSNQSYSVLSITWMQGESNRLGHIARWDPPVEPKQKFMEIYINDLIELKKDLQNDITAITLQKNNIPMFTYQTCFVDIGTAQLIACDREKDLFMIGPVYMLPNAQNSRMWATQEHGAAIHLSADGQRWLGEMYGKVIRKVIFEKKSWMPLRPIEASCTRRKSKIQVKFHVPAPPLVLDSVFLPKQTNSFGFDVYDSHGSYKISKVSVLNDSVVEITMADKIKRNTKYYVSYGLQSYAGKISKPILKISEDTVNQRMHCIVIEFEGNILGEFAVIANEGTFTLGNLNTTAKDLTSVLVRKVSINSSGNTELLCEKNDLRFNVLFKQGQDCYIARAYEYGNLRDSDTEESTFTFKDKGYGNRFGQKYPLYNWSVAFDDLLIKTK